VATLATPTAECLTAIITTFKLPISIESPYISVHAETHGRPNVRTLKLSMEMGSLHVVMMAVRHSAVDVARVRSCHFIEEIIP
jgi:hypothetical protein